MTGTLLSIGLVAVPIGGELVRLGIQRLRGKA